MRINHVIKIGQWRCAPQIRPAAHFVVFLNFTVHGRRGPPKTRFRSVVFTYLSSCCEIGFFSSRLHYASFVFDSSERTDRASRQLADGRGREVAFAEMCQETLLLLLLFVVDAQHVCEDDRQRCRPAQVALYEPRLRDDARLVGPRQLAQSRVCVH